MKYLLKHGKACLHRYPEGQKFCQNSTSKFLFYEKNGFKKYSYINCIVLYEYLMAPIFPILCFAFFVKNSKIEYDPHFWGGENSLKIGERSLFRNHIQKKFTELLHTPVKYEQNPPYGCEAIAKRKCGSGGVSSPIYKQASRKGRLIIREKCHVLVQQWCLIYD